MLFQADVHRRHSQLVFTRGQQLSIVCALKVQLHVCGEESKKPLFYFLHLPEVRVQERLSREPREASRRLMDGAPSDARNACALLSN